MKQMNEKENQQDKEREVQREQSNREELVERIARALPEDGKLEPIKGLRLTRFSQIGEPVYGVSDPTFCIIAQLAAAEPSGSSFFDGPSRR